MGCCGQITKPKVQRQDLTDTPAEVQQTPPPPAPIPFVNGNVNSQRASETLRTNYHRLRFGRW